MVENQLLHARVPRDFRRFAPSEMILEPTPEMLPSEQLYTICSTAVPGAPDNHLMFPAIWNGSVDDTTRIALASSHDGKTWHWVPGGDLLRTGPFGRWDGGCVWATPDLIELPNGDWALPYLAHTFPHKYPRGRNVGSTGYAVWPKGRLVAVEAQDHGEFTMIPVIASGKRLKVNALTLRTGRPKPGRLCSHRRRSTRDAGDVERWERHGDRRGEARDPSRRDEAGEDFRSRDGLTRGGGEKNTDCIGDCNRS